ncbi:MAG: DUF1611 domain-containing protein [Planctomycetes bacterium]|nr:DUF1611 domain-containing protein [Planctomycetota bacterium]
MKPSALLLTHGRLATPFGKTAHGLIRGPSRYRVLAVVDGPTAGRDAGEVIGLGRRDIPVFESVAASFAAGIRPDHCVIGVATPGGVLPQEMRGDVRAALAAGVGIVNGLHHLIGDDPEFAAMARAHGTTIHDLRRPPPTSTLHFWTGAIDTVRAPRIAVLGTDCALGKRTTCQALAGVCRAAGIRTEIVYTGQTGWLQGLEHGFILDATPNDFVSGELEHAIVSCDRDLAPELILLEGQSALRNPSGPCGAELLLSGGARGVVLQHAPGRVFFEDLESQQRRIPAAADEIELIARYGARVLAVTVHDGGAAEADVTAAMAALQRTVTVPVVHPLRPEIERLVPVIRDFLAEVAP